MHATCTVLPVKSDSDFMFCLQNYHGLRIDRSHVYTSDLSIRFSSSEVYTLVFYLAIVNKYYVTVTLGWHDSSLTYTWWYKERSS